MRESRVVPSRSGILLLASLTVATAGCVSIKPYSAVRREVPARDFVMFDGRAVHVESRGSGRPLVLLHGFGESTYTWRRVVPALSERYRTIAIDLYGFGWTERPTEPAAYSRDGQLRLITGVMDSLGVPSATLVGHSYGGALALALAALEPARVEALVLIDSAAPTYPDARKSRVAGSAPLVRLALPWALSRTSIRRSLRRAFFDDELATRALVDRYRERLAVEGVAHAYAFLSAPPRSAGPAVDVASIRQPALFVWGSEDALIPLRGGREAAAQLPSSEFVTIPHCGHVPIEENPDAVVAAVLPFLARSLSQAPRPGDS